MPYFSPLVLNVAIALVFLILGVIFDRKGIRYKEKRDALKESRTIFHDLLVKIKHEEIPYPASISNIIADNFFNTDSAFEAILLNACWIKRIQIRKAYKKYKQPKHTKNSECSYDYILYDFDEKQMKEHKLKFKTGKELLLHNLKTIINLTK